MSTSIARRKRQYRTLLEERIQQPRHQGRILLPDYAMQCQNPLCGDCITTTIRLSQSADRIEEIKHDAVGCGISIASADLMAEALLGCSVSEAAKISQQFAHMLLEKEEMPESAFKKLNALSGISQFPIKIKCALLCWQTLEPLFDQGFMEQQKTLNGEIELS